MQMFWNDLNSGVRQLLNQPWSSAFAIGALANDSARNFSVFSGVMMARVGMVLLVTCVNVASMLPAKGEACADELSALRYE
jgi:hypothetical protein